MPIKCLIIDDEPLAIMLIEKHIEQIPQLEIVAKCQNALEAFEILKKEKIDLLFLDIQMPVLTGLEFAKSLPNRPSIIFTTAYREYAVESYELDVVDYLLKPIPFSRFFKAINKYLNTQQQMGSTDRSSSEVKETTPDFIYVNSNKKYIKVLFEEILYIESIKDYVRIHTKDQRIMTKDKISEFELKVTKDFLRVHRSFIVNRKQITAFTAHDIEIGKTEIPIGGSYKKRIFEVLNGK